MSIFEKLDEVIPFDKSKEIYHKIRCSKIASKFDLMESTNLKSGTITRLLEELLNQELILEAGYGESTGGRKPILYKTNPKFGFVLGLNLSRTFSTLVLSDLHLNVISTYEWKMDDTVEPYQFFDMVIAKVKKMLDNQSIAIESVLGIGIGTVGPLDERKRVMLDPYGFPGEKWKNILVCDYFEEKLKLPTLLDNGACTALRGEFWLDKPYQYKDLVYLHLGIGFRSAIMSNGKIMSGAIGQMIIQTDGIPPYNPYGNYGALHSYVIIHYILEQAKSRLKQGRKSTLKDLISNIDDLNFNHMLTSLEDKDPMVVEIFTQSATYLGIGLANLINIFHPEKIIIGGPLPAKVDLFYKVATETALEKTYYYPLYNVSFSKPKLGDDGLAIGAGAMIIDYLTTFI